MWNALAGGALIGLAVSWMLLGNGRVTGISGILNGVLSPAKGDTLWRIFFLLGLWAGGLVLFWGDPSWVTPSFSSKTQLAVAGLLVGFGTVMGSGCTSGHGVCGLSRLSPRSIVATLLFISAGILSVYLVRSFL